MNKHGGTVAVHALLPFQVLNLRLVFGIFPFMVATRSVSTSELYLVRLLNSLTGCEDPTLEDMYKYFVWGFMTRPWFPILCLNNEKIVTQSDYPTIL